MRIFLTFIIITSLKLFYDFREALLSANLTEVVDILSDLVSGDVLDEMETFAYYYIGW